MAEELSRLDREVMQWISGFLKENGYSPTLREVMTGVGSGSFRAVNASLNRLRRLDMLTWRENASRTLRLVQDDHESG